MVWLIRAQFDDRARNSATQGLLRRRQNTWRPDMRGGANPGGTTPTRARPRIPCRNSALAPKPALGVRVGKSGPGRVQPTLATPVLAGGAWRRRRCAGPAGEHQRLERGRRSDIKGGLSRTRVALPHGPQCRLPNGHRHQMHTQDTLRMSCPSEPLRTLLGPCSDISSRNYRGNAPIGSPLA